MAQAGIVISCKRYGKKRSYTHSQSFRIASEFRRILEGSKGSLKIFPETFTWRPPRD